MQRLVSIDDIEGGNYAWAWPYIDGLYQTFLQHKESNTYPRKVEVEIGNQSRSNGLHASEAVGCFRRLVYSLMDTERVKEDPKRLRNHPDVLRKFGNVSMKEVLSPERMNMRLDLGHCVHSVIQSDFDHMLRFCKGRITFKPEVRIHPSLQPIAKKYNIKSSCDGVFTFYDEDFKPFIRLGVEVKTMSDGEFRKYAEKSQKPKEEALQQATIYQKSLDLPLMWFVIYNKSNSEITKPTGNFLTVFRKSIWDSLLKNKIEPGYRMAEHNKLPSKDEGFGCTFCPYTWTCKPSCLYPENIGK